MTIVYKSVARNGGMPMAATEDIIHQVARDRAGAGPLRPDQLLRDHLGIRGALPLGRTTSSEGVGYTKRLGSGYTACKHSSYFLVNDGALSERCEDTGASGASSLRRDFGGCGPARCIHAWRPQRSIV
jgi:hypothetical protein